jgi:serine/threonine protein phosphatase 1
MATYAVGDIHGQLPALNDVLEHLRREGRNGDTIVFLGDYIDRGADSKGCIDAILKFRSETDAEVVCLVGNHEDWFLDALHNPRSHAWLLLGEEAFATIRSYSPEAERILRDAKAQAGLKAYLGQSALPYQAFFDCLPAEHLEFFEGLALYHRTADCLCTHGGVDTDEPRVDRQARRALIWGAGMFPDGYDGPDVVVYGHRNNATRDARDWPMPTVVGNTIGIDTISHGVLTAIRLPDRQIFQSARYERRRRD